MDDKLGEENGRQKAQKAHKQKTFCPDRKGISTPRRQDAKTEEALCAFAPLRLCIKKRRDLRVVAAKERKELRDKNLCCSFFAISAFFCGNSSLVAVGRAAFST